jgi:hypothetical protein
MEFVVVFILVVAMAAFMLREAEHSTDTARDNSLPDPDNTPPRMMGWCATGYLAQLEKEGLLDDSVRRRPEESGNSE